MKNFSRSILLVFATLIVSACSSGGTPVVNYTDITKVDFEELQKMKTTTACETSVLGLSVGDQSIVRAARKAGIKKVEVVDIEKNNFLIGGQSCVRIYGN